MVSSVSKARAPQPLKSAPAWSVSAVSDLERLKLAVDVWKHVVSVQMHFNDMEMKVRNLYFTILAAAIGAIGVMHGRRIEITYLDMKVSVVLVILFAIVLVSALFYFIDRHWYHRLLMGAVKLGAQIEKDHQLDLPEIQLGTRILDESPVHLKKRRWKWLFFFVHDPRFREESKLHSDQKIEVLYKSVMWLVGLIALAYAFVSGVQFDGRPLAACFFGTHQESAKPAPVAQPPAAPPPAPITQPAAAQPSAPSTPQPAPAVQPPAPAAQPPAVPPPGK